MPKNLRLALIMSNIIFLMSCQALMVPEVILSIGSIPSIPDSVNQSIPKGTYIRTTPVQPNSLSSVKTIALLDIPEPPSEDKDALVFCGLNFGNASKRYLTQFLQENGYRVVTHPVNRPKVFKLIDDYEKIDISGVDAYLDVVPQELKYELQTMLGAEVGPRISVVVRLVSAHTHEIIWSDTIGYGLGSVFGTKNDLPENSKFESAEAFKANRGEALAHMLRGIEAVSLEVARNLSKGEFNSEMSGEAGKILDAEASNSLQGIGDVPANDRNLSGIYVSEITGRIGRLDAESSGHLEVSIQHNGNKIEGEFGLRGGVFEGSVENNTITFCWYSSWTHGRGEWVMEKESNDFVGTWTSGAFFDSGKRTAGKWNIKRIR